MIILSIITPKTISKPDLPFQFTVYLVSIVVLMCCFANNLFAFVRKRFQVRKEEGTIELPRLMIILIFLFIIKIGVNIQQEFHLRKTINFEYDLEL